MSILGYRAKRIFAGNRIILPVVSSEIFIKSIATLSLNGTRAAVRNSLGISRHGRERERPHSRSRTRILIAARSDNSRTHANSGSNSFYIYNFAGGADPLCMGNGNTGELI